MRSGEFEPHAPASALSPTPAADSDSLLGRQGQGDTSSPSSPSVLDGPQSSSGDSSASTGQDGLEGMRARLLRAIGPEGDLETVNAWRASLGKQPLEQLSPEHRESALQWFEAPNGTARYLSWVAAQQAERQQRREDAAVRATLLTQAREVLAELNDAVAGEVFERLGLATLDDATEAQLRAVVTLGRGAGGGA